MLSRFKLFLFAVPWRYVARFVLTSALTLSGYVVIVLLAWIPGFSTLVLDLIFLIAFCGIPLFAGFLAVGYRIVRSIGDPDQNWMLLGLLFTLLIVSLSLTQTDI